MAPKSQPLKGSWALLVSPAKASRITGMIATVVPLPMATRSCKVFTCSTSAAYTMATANPRPPNRFIHKARKELRTASGVLLYPMSRKEQRLVISQKKYIQVKLLEKIRPNMAPKNTKSMAKKKARRSLYSLCLSW